MKQFTLNQLYEIRDSLNEKKDIDKLYAITVQIKRQEKISKAV